MEKIRGFAELSHRFDEMRVNNSNDLPIEPRQKEFSGTSLGKPWAILNEMEYMKDDYILVYSDFYHIFFSDGDWKLWKNLRNLMDA